MNEEKVGAYQIVRTDTVPGQTLSIEDECGRITFNPEKWEWYEDFLSGTIFPVLSDAKKIGNLLIVPYIIVDMTEDIVDIMAPN